MAETLLSLKGVQTRIGRYHILHGVDFDVPEGGLTMLLGRNGAGKTTTLRTIMGMWRAAAGGNPFPAPANPQPPAAHLPPPRPPPWSPNHAFLPRPPPPGR